MNTVAKTKHINIRTTEQEYRAIQSLANFRGKTISSLIVDALWDQVEDWEDLRAIENYEKCHQDEPTISHDALMKELGLA
ncbi:MAG: DUF6290 family protein [Clostridiales Family XIII bacterium]|jgi:uncharacterized protein (DUF1778 family)|nr:DUF6290 family protein [Clostridiales Family XIII bacterium]